LPSEDKVLSRGTARLVLIFRQQSSVWNICHSSVSVTNNHQTADGEEFTTPVMGFSIWNTPANSSWVYDYADNFITRTD
jgi:hypothetical protein